jgi:mono/diheme cytochrome c family protein
MKQHHPARRAASGLAFAGWLCMGLLAGLPAVAQAADPSVQRGEYLARAGDCISCHTRPGGLPFAGGLAMQTPFGTIISTNITPAPGSGIGGYTQADFNQALRQGRAQDGHYLYPAMPYNHFAQIGDTDLQDLYAYFMQGVKPEVQANATTQLAWPFSMRWLMKLWNVLYLKDARFQPVPTQTAEWNRGAYLVQGLGHCSACHTPRSFTGGEKASSEADGDAFLSGTTLDGWYAEPLRQLEGVSPPGLGAWSRPELVDYLKTGRNARTAAFGAMVAVVGNSTQYLSHEDLNAIAVYLKSLGSGAPAANGPTPAVSKSTVPMVDDADPTTLALRAGDTAFLLAQPGALVYLNNCSACHRSDGQGASRTFPSLAHSSSVAAGDPTSLIRIVLKGSAMPHTAEAPSELGMPALGWRLGDDKVAEVLSFVRRSWGNQAAPVTAKAVASVRAFLPADPAAPGTASRALKATP